MRKRGQITGAILLGIALLGPARVPGQDRPLTVTGEVVAGFTQQSDNSADRGGALAGFNADVKGYWLHPRVLTYEIAPTITLGHRFTGPAWESGGDGVRAQTTFLGGSSMPLHVSFSRMQYSQPELQSSADPLGGPKLSESQQSFAIDWVARFRKLPPVTIRYGREAMTSTTIWLGEESTRTANDSLNLSTGFQLRGWNLSSSFDKNNWENRTSGNSATALNAALLDGANGAQSLNFGAWRTLPLHSTLGLTAYKQDTDLETNGRNFATSTFTSNASLSSAWTRKLTTSLTAAYVSNTADMARQRILQGETLSTDLVVTPLGANYVSTGAGITYRATQALSLSGNAQLMSNDSDAGGSVHGRSLSAAAAYSRRWLGGDGSVTYTHAVQHAEGALASDGTLNTLTGSYVHRLPARLLGSASASYSSMDLREAVSSDSRNYNGSFALSRRDVRGWTLSARFELTHMQTTAPQMRNLNHGLLLSATSEKFQVSFARRYTDATTFRVGTRLIEVDNLSPFTPAGLPQLSVALGSITDLTVLWRARKRLRIAGSYLSTRNEYATGVYEVRGVDIRMEYNFRAVRMTTGFMQEAQAAEVPGVPNRSLRRVYVQFSRNFHLYSR